MNLTLTCAWAIRAVLLCSTAIAGSTWAADYRLLEGGEFRSVLPADGESSPASIQPFWLRSTLVSNAEYLEFLQAHPQWRRGTVPGVLAGADYLALWAGPLVFAPLQAGAPVTQVSWHAAQAYCASEQARLPTWYEWEFAAAADEQRADARGDPVWLARILSWYSRPASQPPQAIGLQPANYYGIHDLHELTWEWVEDFNGLFVSADSRTQGEQKQLAFCGGAALSLSDKNNYAVLIRLSLLAAMEANQGGNYLGFRCARDPALHLSGAPNE